MTRSLPLSVAVGFVAILAVAEPADLDAVEGAPLSCLESRQVRLKAAARSCG